LAAEEVDEAASAGAAIGAEQAHSVEEDEERENLRVLDGRKVRRHSGMACDRAGMCRVHFRFVEESGQSGVEFALDGRDGRFFVEDAGRQRLEGFGEGFESGEDVGIGGVRVSGAEFRCGEGNPRKNHLVHVDVVAGDFGVEQRRIGGQFALVLVFVAVRGEEIAAVWRAVDGDFPVGAAADRTDLFALGGAEARFFAFLADRTAHESSWTAGSKEENIVRVNEKGSGRTEVSAGRPEHRAETVSRRAGRIDKARSLKRAATAVRKRR